MKIKPTIFKIAPFVSIGIVLLVFGLGLNASAMTPEDTPVPTVVGISPAGGAILLEPGGPPTAPGLDVNPLETYLGPEGERLTPSADAAALAAVAPIPGDYFITVSASNFPARESAATNAYGGAGCSYRTSAGGFFTYPLTLPDGVVIRGIRMTFFDSSPVNGVLYLYKFTGLGGYTALASASTSGATGYGSASSPPISHTVDTQGESLALILDYANVSSADLQFCNITVSYSAKVNLPLVVK